MEAGSNVILKLDRLTRRIEVGGTARAIVDNVSFEFAARRIYTVVGPSGAGKSSLLRLINRLDEPSSGHVLLHGTPAEDLAPSELRRRVGFLFQRPHLFEGTVADNLRYVKPELDGEAMRKLAEKARFPVSLLEADASSLSVGESQRVALARVLALEPEVILLDEPTSALDPTLTEGIEATFRALAAENGTTLIMVSHDPPQALRMGGTVLLIAEGKLAEHGPAERVLQDPQSMAGKRYRERRYDVDS